MESLILYRQRLRTAASRREHHMRTRGLGIADSHDAFSQRLLENDQPCSRDAIFDDPTSGDACRYLQGKADLKVSMGISRPIVL